MSSDTQPDDEFHDDDKSKARVLQRVIRMTDNLAAARAALKETPGTKGAIKVQRLRIVREKTQRLIRPTLATNNGKIV